MNFIFTLILLLTLILPSTSWTRTFTVGSDNCDYTTIQSVFNQEDLEPGDIIEVHEGTYHEQVVWGSDDDGDETGYVTLKAKPGDHVTITGDRTRDYCIRLVDRHYCQIIGIECIQALNGISIYKGDHYQIKNCISHDHDTTLGSYPVGIRIVGASYANVLSSRVYDVSWNGIKIASEADIGDSTDFLISKCDVTSGHTSIDLKSSTNSSLRNVLITRNKIHGHTGIYSENTTSEQVSNIQIYYNLLTDCEGAHIAGQTRSGDTDHPFTLWKICNNTFDKSGTAVANSHIEFLDGLTNSEIKNNILSRANYANIGGQTRSLRISSDVTNLELDHNCYYSLYSDSQTLINWNGTAYNTLSAFQTATGQESHGIAENPLLKSNYQLKDTSPCIDAAEKLLIHTNNWEDFSGNTTRYGTLPDIGCYEAKVWPTGFWGLLPWAGSDHKIQWDYIPSQHILDATPSGAETLTLNLSLPVDKEITIDWGDGNTTTVTGAVSSTDFSNAYASAGTYPVTFYGDFDALTRLEIKDVAVDGDLRDIGALTALTYFRSAFDNTWAGDIKYLPSNLTYFACYGSATVTGDIATAPRSLTYFNCAGNNTVYGDVIDAPRGLEYFYCHGSSSLTGDVANLPPNIRKFGTGGNNTIYGNIRDFPSTLDWLSLSGHNTVTGNISDLPAGLTAIYLTGDNTINAYTSRTWTTKPATFRLIPVSPGGLSSAEIDQLLIDLDDDLTWASGDAIIFTGSNAPRTSASDAAVSNMTAEGATIITN